MAHLARPPSAAAYRPDFYTGKARREAHGILHITQWHEIKENIGRQPVGGVLAGWKYVIENELRSDGTLRAGEYAVNLTTGERIKQIHDSRGQYTDCRRANIDVFAILAQGDLAIPEQENDQVMNTVAARGCRVNQAIGPRPAGLLSTSHARASLDQLQTQNPRNSR